MKSIAKRHAEPWLEQSMRQAASLASVPGLSADAVLCVRHLTAKIDTHTLHHGGGLLNTANRVSRQLQVLASAARRPAHEVVPESAEAVLFDDPAEMLACAARDWLDGQFSRHWWWRGLLDGGASALDVIALWYRHARHIPAALAALNARAEEFCRRITVSEADVLIARLIETSTPHVRHLYSGALADRPPLLTELAPEDPRQQLLAIGLSLTETTVRAHRALAASRPAHRGVQTTAPDVGEQRAQRLTQLRPNEIPDSASALGREAEARNTATGAMQTRSAMTIPEQQTLIRPTAMPSPEQVENTPKQTERDVSGAPKPNAAHRQNDRSSPDPRTETKSETLPSQTPTLGRVQSLPGAAAPVAAAHLLPHPKTGQWFETRYGGVLYLLNVAIHLGLYSDFTQPRNPGLALSPWAFLALSGERLAGRRLHRDALWTLLAALAGTEAERPLFSSDTSPPSLLPESLRPYLRAQERATPTLADSWPGWIDQLMPPLRRRLAAAMGVPPRQAGRLLCCQSARIRFGIGHLDAHFNLNDHPIAIRLAGLDRDPGWMPAAGCDIRFCYDGNIVE